MNTNPRFNPGQMPQQKGGSGINPIAAVAIILGVLLLGGLYYFTMNFDGNNEGPAATVQDLKNSDDPDVQAMLQQGSSDELDSIQADVDATNMAAIDAAVADVTASLESQ